jgi:tRNA (guanine-N7-)-methyltransferase
MALPLSRSLQETVVDWRRGPWPIPWSAVFGREAPLALEIGFGNGAFLAEQARARPERDHVGLELSWTSATHLFRRLARAELANVRVVLGDAEALLGRLFAPDSLCEVFVNHPCPWPKARHVERRLLGREFLAALAERMQPGARLTVVTDHAEYARWLGDELRAQSALVSRHGSVEVAALPGRTPTKYQLKAVARGIPIHYFEWHKLTGPRPPPEPRPHPREVPMPTLTLSGEVAGDELFRGFHPVLFRELHQGLEVAVKLEAVYKRCDAPVWLLETLVQEDRLRQQFGIDVVARGPSLLLKPSVLGQPYPTHGVKRAVWCAARWLRSRHPALAIQHESLGLDEPAEPWPPACTQETIQE